MSNTSKMESKITIHTGDDFKPVIKVLEKESEDVRDNLVSQFRHLLRHTSRSCRIEFIGVPEKDNLKAGYYICPVTEEMEYFKEVILDRMTGGLPTINDQTDRVREFFDWLKKEEHVFG